MDYKTEYVMWQIWSKIQSETTSQDADRIIAPLLWWVSTGRCSGKQTRTIANLTKRQATTIAKRLISCGGFSDYNFVIAKVVDYINKF